MTRSASPVPGVVLGLGLLIGLLAPVQGRAASYITPPIMPIANAWQGRSQAVVRVLDKLDAHVETLTLKAGETGSYKSLSVTVRSCMDRPDGLPVENGAFLDIQDRRGGVQPFSGWTFSGQPSIGVFESPIYAVRLASCGAAGAAAAPAGPAAGVDGVEPARGAAVEPRRRTRCPRRRRPVGGLVRRRAGSRRTRGRFVRRQRCGAPGPGLPDRTAPGAGRQSAALMAHHARKPPAAPLVLVP